MIFYAFRSMFSSTRHRQLGKSPAHSCVLAMTMCLCLELCATGEQATGGPCPALSEAHQLIEQQQWREVAQRLRGSIAAYPLCAEAHYLLGYALLRTNDPTASLKEYSTAATLRPPTSNDFVAVASDYILLKAYSDAERWLLRATQAIPVNPQAWYLLGRAQYNLDRNTDAVASFKHSLALLPEDPRSEYNLGLAYERLQEPELARNAYKTAIQWSERRGLHDAQPYLDLGTLDRSQGNPQQALPLLQQAAELSPTNPLIFQELGRTLSDLGRLDEAIAAFSYAIQLAPSAEAPHFFLGRAYRAAGKLPEAGEQFAIVQRLAKNQSTATTPNIDRTH